MEKKTQNIIKELLGQLREEAFLLDLTDISTTTYRSLSSAVVSAMYSFEFTSARVDSAESSSSSSSSNCLVSSTTSASALHEENARQDLSTLLHLIISLKFGIIRPEHKENNKKCHTKCTKNT